MCYNYTHYEFLKLIIPALVGTVITIGSFLLDTDSILASANEAARILSEHEIRNAIEIYYLDHDAYPGSGDANKMLKDLYLGSYIDKLRLIRRHLPIWLQMVDKVTF